MIKRYQVPGLLLRHLVINTFTVLTSICFFHDPDSLVMLSLILVMAITILSFAHNIAVYGNPDSRRHGLLQTILLLLLMFFCVSFGTLVCSLAACSVNPSMKMFVVEVILTLLWSLFTSFTWWYYCVY